MLPYKNKNFGSTLQLLEEEMAQEYGDEQPFIDPGSQAYEAFDYQEPQDNGSSEGKAALELGLLPAQLLPPAQLGPGGAGVRHQRRCLAKPSFPDAIITVALLAANNKRHQDLCQVKHFFDIVYIIYV